MRDVLIGQTDYTVLVRMASTTGAPVTGLAHTDIDIAYARVETDNDVTTSDVSPASLSALTDVHSDWGWKEVSSGDHPGLYRLDIADAVFASGAWEAVVTITDASGTDFYATDIGFRLVNIDPQASVVPANVTQFGGSNGTFASGKPAVGAADSVTGAVGSVTGNVGGNVVGSTASVVGAVGSVTGNVGGNVNGNVAGSVGSVSGSVGSVTGAVGSVTGAVGSVTGNVGGNVVGSTASVAGAVGSVAGNVDGDVGGKVLGGGSGTITGDGVRASSVTGAVGSVTGAVGGNVTGSVGSVATDGIAAASIASAAGNKIADHVRRRTQANVEASSDGDAVSKSSEYGFIQQAQESNTTDNAGKLTIYKTDGTTELGQITIATDAAAEPVTGVS